MKTCQLLVIPVVTATMLVSAATAHAAPKRGWASAGGVIDLRHNMRAKPGRIEDRALIQELFARWGIAFDEGRIDVVESLLTADARYRVLNGSPTPIVSLDGRADILEGVRRVMAAQDTQRRHVISNVVIDRLTATTASAIAYGIVVLPDTPIVVSGTIVYSADLVLDHGVWRFSKFVIGSDSAAPPLPGPPLPGPPLPR